MTKGRSVSHIVYQVHKGTMRTGRAPDGALIELGATDWGGNDAKPITVIDWNSEMYCRAGGDWTEFPRKWFRASDIVWDSDVAKIQ